MNKREFKRKYWYPMSVDIERTLRKIRIRVDRWYRYNWSFIFAGYIMFVIGLAIIPFKHDLDVLLYRIEQSRQINQILDEPFSDRFQHWRTEGNPGQEPPKP